MQLRCSALLAMFAGLLFGGHAAAAEASDPLAAWLERVRACAAKNVPRIAVLGLDRADTAVSRQEAEEIRLAMENRLQKAGGLLLTSGADVTRLKAMREGTIGLSAAEAEAQIRAAFDGDAAIFFVSADRQTNRVRFRLQAITRAADCKATSEPIDIVLGAAPSLADVGQVMENAVQRLVAAAPNLRFVDVLPFSALAGHSICSAALTDTLMVALDAEAHNPGRTLNGKTLTTSRLIASRASEAGRVSAHGTFELDRENRAFLSLEFIGEGGATIAPTGRVPIAIDRLACDPAIRPFLDHVAASARTDASRLGISAPVFTPGQRLEVSIKLTRPMPLYCWVLAPDGTGYVTLPIAGRPQPVRAGTLRYPRDFGLADIVLDQPFENLFACFGVEHNLPPAVDQLWRDHAPGATADAKLIERDALATLMADLRAVPGIVEATAPIVVH